ncbi:MAG: hypothetical protein ACLS9K_10525 [Lachnospira eligens]
MSKAVRLCRCVMQACGLVSTALEKLAAEGKYIGFRTIDIHVDLEAAKRFWNCVAHSDIRHIQLPIIQ